MEKVSPAKVFQVTSRCIFLPLVTEHHTPLLEHSGSRVPHNFSRIDKLESWIPADAYRLSELVIAEQ